MSDFYTDKPARTYEITWQSGHVETVTAHQVTWPGAGAAIFGIRDSRPPRVQFHAEIDGIWTVTLSAPEEDIRIIRDVTVGEAIPAGDAEFH